MGINKIIVGVIAFMSYVQAQDKNESSVNDASPNDYPWGIDYSPMVDYPQLKSGREVTKEQRDKDYQAYLDDEAKKICIPRAKRVQFLYKLPKARNCRKAFEDEVKQAQKEVDKKCKRRILRGKRSGKKSSSTTSTRSSRSGSSQSTTTVVVLTPQEIRRNECTAAKSNVQKLSNPNPSRSSCIRDYKKELAFCQSKIPHQRPLNADEVAEATKNMIISVVIWLVILCCIIGGVIGYLVYTNSKKKAIKEENEQLERNRIRSDKIEKSKETHTEMMQIGTPAIVQQPIYVQQQPQMVQQPIMMPIGQQYMQQPGMGMPGQPQMGGMPQQQQMHMQQQMPMQQPMNQPQMHQQQMQPTEVQQPVNMQPVQQPNQ